MKHKHIPFGNGHITMIGDAEPTKEMIEAFKKIQELALSLPLVNCQREQFVCEHNGPRFNPTWGEVVCGLCYERLE